MYEKTAAACRNRRYLRVYASFSGIEAPARRDVDPGSESEKEVDQFKEHGIDKVTEADRRHGLAPSG
jgi:hypothetical protein